MVKDILVCLDDGVGIFPDMDLDCFLVAKCVLPYETPVRTIKIESCFVATLVPR